MSVVITPTDIETESRRPWASIMSCLPLKYLNGWLFGINANRVNPDLRDRVVRHQRECYEILAAALITSGQIKKGPTSEDKIRPNRGSR